MSGHLRTGRSVKRQIILNTMQRAMAGSAKLPDEDVARVRAGMLAALERFSTGDHCREHWASMADASNVAEELSRLGICSDEPSRALIEDAQRTLGEVAVRAQQRAQRRHRRHRRARMSRKPARVGEDKLQLLRDLLAQAGTEGLMLAELLTQLPGWSRTSIYSGINQLLEAGHSFVERQHPFAVHFAASVLEAERRATFQRRMREERQRRGQAVRDGTEAHLKRQGRALRTATRLRKPVRAVDPHALRPDAVVTTPEGVEVQHCPGYRTKWERHAAEVKPPSLPAEPPRALVQAVLEQRDKERA